MLHFFIGGLADWTGKLAPILGREDTFAMIEEQYTRLMPAMYISYAGMFLFALTNFFAVVTKKNSSASEDDFVPFANAVRAGKQKNTEVN